MPNEVDSIAWTVIDANFTDTLANRLDVAQTPRLDAQ